MKDESYDTFEGTDPKFWWRSVEEYPLGDFKNGSEFILYRGYQEKKLFVVDTNMGREYVAGYIENGSGDLVDMDGNDFGWKWDAVSWWSHIPEPDVGE